MYNFTDTPFGQLPVLEHNGRKIPQTLAICRFLAKQVKLAGNDDWEDLEIDSIVQTVNDIRQSMNINDVIIYILFMHYIIIFRYWQISL